MLTSFVVWHKDSQRSLPALHPCANADFTSVERLRQKGASKIAEALEVSLDYLAGNSKVLLEKNIVKRITDIQQLPTDDKAHLFALMDAFLRDHKAKKAS